MAPAVEPAIAACRVSGDRLELALANRRDACEAARAAVADFLAPHAPSAPTVYRVELILEETLMNLVWHAFGDGAPHLIDFSLELQPGAIVMEFGDDGMPFDPTRALLPAPPTSIDAAVPGGLGLGLIRRYAQAIGYERRDGRNILTVVVARS